MIQKARFVSVDSIRPFEVEDKVSGTKRKNWCVTYLVEFELDGVNGSFKQQLLAEATYDQEPTLKVGPLDSSRLYEMKLLFSVKTNKKDGRLFQHIRLTHYTEVIDQPQA